MTNKNVTYSPNVIVIYPLINKCSIIIKNYFPILGTYDIGISIIKIDHFCHLQHFLCAMLYIYNDRTISAECYNFVRSVGCVRTFVYNIRFLT